MEWIIDRLTSTEMSLWWVYFLVYLPVGFFMNQFGIWMSIARFTYKWQVLTCYGVYMVPVSILVRDLPFHQQYLWGLLSMCLLEFSGYALGTSKAIGVRQEGNTVTIEGNVLAKIVDIKNFSLAMAIFFGVYIPAGNAAVSFVHGLL